MNKLYKLIFFLLILGIGSAEAQIDTNEFNDLDEIDIYSLLKESVFKKVVVRFEESPGNLTEISKDEFMNRGARDLMDVLRMAPGFEFAQNINGQIGIGYQGMWAQQNKITILIDNVAMNDGLQGGFAIAQRIPLGMIEKIQIIKGAGSIQFLGANTMSTINIITRSGNTMEGARITLFNGSYDSTFARRGVSLVMGDNIAKNKYWSFIGSYNNGKITNVAKINNTPWESQCNLLDIFAFAKLKLNKWDFKYLLNNYNSQAAIRQSTVKSLIQNLQISNEFKIKKTDLTILPTLNVSQQLPMNWIMPNPWVTDTNNMMQTKAQARLMLRHSFEDNKIKSLSYFGIDYNWEQNTILYHKTKLDPYSSTSFYAQNVFQKNLSRIYINRLLVKTGIKADMFASQKVTISPKVGVEYYYKNFQINAFAGRYGMNPNNYGNYLVPNLKQEQIQTAQFRVNYILKSNCNVAANLFVNKASNMISFMQNKYYTDTFVNITTAGSKGIELEFNWKLFDGMYLKSYYTYFQKANKDSNQYSIEQGNSGLLGFASHKLYASLQYNLASNYWVNINGQYYSKITGIRSGIRTEQNPLLMLDLTLKYASPKSPIEVQTGIYNILNNNFKYFQAYSNMNNTSGINNPVPGGGREFFIKVIFKLRFYDNDHQSYNYSNPIIF
ncbi:MAG: TonB-dependent receptor plug domain-containing protein [Bacteroidota bacterium]|nr:TonB-dependent receptor plug domain-containing protein [Bacteroidota bacterium]